MDSASRYTLIESVSITRKQCSARRGMSYSDLTENAELIDFVRDDLKDAIMYAEHKHGEKLDPLLSAVQSAKTVYDMFAAIETAIDAKLEDVCDLLGYDLPKIPADDSDKECLEDRKDEESFILPAWIDENTTETLENINGDLAVIYYWDDSFEFDACRGYEIFPDGDLQKGRGMVPCGDADKAYSILSRKGFRY